MLADFERVSPLMPGCHVAGDNFKAARREALPLAQTDAGRPKVAWTPVRRNSHMANVQIGLSWRRPMSRGAIDRRLFE